MSSKANAPSIASADQNISPAEATALLQQWCSRKQRAYATRDTNRRRVVRWIEKYGLESLTTSDLCDEADHYNIPIPSETPRHTKIIPSGLQINTDTGTPDAYTEREEILEELSRCKARINQLEKELAPLREDADRRRKAGIRYKED